MPICLRVIVEARGAGDSTVSAFAGLAMVAVFFTAID
jgi:hypothetical protein